VNRNYPDSYHITLPYSVEEESVKNAVDALFKAK
jgi:hypothetical protein